MKERDDASQQERWSFQLFVAGGQPRSEAAQRNLKHLCEKSLPGRYEIEVIDLVKDPDRGREADIAALPTLIRTLPPPMRRVVGDLSATEDVLVALEYATGKGIK